MAEVLDQAIGKDFIIYNGDSNEVWAELPDNSIDFSIYSLPFLDLYTYSPSERDMGNCRNEEEFFKHYAFLNDHIMRTTKPGRLTAVHCADVQTKLGKDGYIGRKDFPGMIIQAYQRAGWIWVGRITIDKNPQIVALRTHSSQLQFSDMEADSAQSHPSIPDYILTFRKPGKNTVPVKSGLTRQEWILWARPIWYAADYLPGTFDHDLIGDPTRKNGASAGDMGISETDTLNAREARGNEDERHIAPLQLGTIERCIRLWSNPGETVGSPFAGIGSEGYKALQLGRRFVGCELKESYYQTAVKNLRTVEAQSAMGDLFTNAGIDV